MLGDTERSASDLREFGPLGILVTVVILAANLIMVPVSAVLVLMWAQVSRTPWRDLGFERPKSWMLTAAIGIAFGVALKFALKAVVLPLLGADPVNHTYHYLVGNAAALPAIGLTVIIAGGFCEETVFRGYMFERMGKLLGHGLGAKILMVAVTTALFALTHYRDQGWAGVEQALFTGSVFGATYAATGRIWTVMFAHAAYDIAAIAIIYWNLESQVAHLIFK